MTARSTHFLHTSRSVAPSPPPMIATRLGCGCVIIAGCTRAKDSSSNCGNSQVLTNS